jgi:hypothetical protein
MNTFTKGLILNENILLGTSPNGLSGVFATDAGKRDHSVAFIIPYNSQINHNLLHEPNVFELSSDRMQDANNYIIRANKNIKREWPTNNETINDKIRRDCYLVRWCQRVYSVGTFVTDDSLLNISDELAWPAQMYIDRFLYDREPFDQCELYMYDLKSENWYMWNTTWYPVVKVNQPTGIYSVVGSDKLSKAAKLAIDALWE